MKVLNNPVVVGALVVVALGLVAFQFRPLWQRSGGAAAPAPASTAGTAAPAPARPAPATPTAPAAPARKATTAGLDVAAIQTNETQWIDHSSKDPFKAHPRVFSADTTPARQLLTLNGVWRQSDTAYAVVNNRLFTVGDMVQQFKITRIEPDSVWVDGPNGREEVPFSLGAKPAPAPAPAPQPAKP